MKTYANIDTNGVVTSLVMTAGVVGGAIEVLGGAEVLGMKWNGSAFVDLPTVEETPTWLISVGAFYDRFGTYKISILASEDVVVQAMVKDAQVRKHIDLQRSDLPTMLDVLIAKGFAIDKTVILETPAAPNELP